MLFRSSSALNINGHTYICVVGYSTNKENYDHCSINDTLALGRYISSHYQYVNLNQKGEKIKTLKVKNGKEDSFDIKLNHDINAVLPNNYDQGKIKYEYQFDKLTAPVKKGEKVGTLEVSYDGEHFYNETFKAPKAVEKDTYTVILDTVVSVIPWILGVFIILIIALLVVRKIIIKRRRRKRRKRRY